MKFIRIIYYLTISKILKSCKKVTDTQTNLAKDLKKLITFLNDNHIKEVNDKNLKTFNFSELNDNKYEDFLKVFIIFLIILGYFNNSIWNKK